MTIRDDAFPTQAASIVMGPLGKPVVMAFPREIATTLDRELISRGITVHPISTSDARTAIAVRFLQFADRAAIESYLDRFKIWLITIAGTEPTSALWFPMEIPQKYLRILREETLVLVHGGIKQTDPIKARAAATAHQTLIEILVACGGRVVS